MKITAFRNRLQIDTSARDGIVEQLMGGNPFFWNGGCTQFEAGLFRKQTIVDDLSNLSQVTLEIFPLNAAGDGPSLTEAALMTSTILSVDFNDDLTLFQWNAGGEIDCHLLFEFVGSEANLDLGGAESKNFWLVIAAKRNDGESVPLGCSILTVAEDGSSVTPGSSGSGNFRFNLGYAELRFDDTTFHRLDPVMLEGRYTLDILQADSDPIADANSSLWHFNGGFPQLTWPDGSEHDLTVFKDSEGVYSIDVNQSAAGSADDDSSSFRLNVGFPELLFPDATWHRIRATIDSEGRYSIDIEQTASE